MEGINTPIPTLSSGGPCRDSAISIAERKAVEYAANAEAHRWLVKQMKTDPPTQAVEEVLWKYLCAYKLDRY